MRRTVGPVAAVLFAVGAKPPPEAAQFLLAAGVVVALLVLLGLPLGLLVHCCRRDWIAAEARAVERRATACVVVGAGLVILAAVVLLVASRANGLVWAALLAAASAWFLVGFAGCARRHGERMLGVPPQFEGIRPLVLGWLARAGLFAAPVVWPFLGTYLVVVAFGAPLVAMFEKDADAPPVT